MKKYPILLLILSMCGGTAESDFEPFAEEMLVAKDVMSEAQEESQKEYKKIEINDEGTTTNGLEKKNILGIKPYKKDDVVAYLYLFDLMGTLDEVIEELLRKFFIEEVSEPLTETSTSTGELAEAAAPRTADIAAAKEELVKAKREEVIAQNSVNMLKFGPSTRPNRRKLVEASSRLSEAKEKVKAKKIRIFILLCLLSKL